MSLTDAAVKNAKPEDKARKLSDGGGLYLLIKPTGYKSWKYDFRLDNTRGSYTIGNYPDIGLKKARQEHREARELVALGTNPKQIKVQRKVKDELKNKRFSFYINQWLDKQVLATSTYSDLKQRIDKNIAPYLDSKYINEYTTADLLAVMLRMSNRGAKETAIRLANILRRVFNEVLILGIIDTNPAQGLAELLPKPDKRIDKNFGHVTSTQDLRILLQQIDCPTANQDIAVTQALKLMPLVFLRPYNIRFLKWEYINFNERIINIPAEELKNNKYLDVPLSNQAFSILKDMLPVTGDKEYVFVTSRGKDTPLSENTTTQALKRFINPVTNEPYGSGFMTSHGFRHTASTMLNELGFNPDIIELQLAHTNKDRIRATYNKAQWMEKRIMMMQAWADYLDGLKNQGNVTPINKRTSA
ncbi:tyrosine-type recombinase/integrase [Thalassotalea psychrophila]|uniref:Tyrosine-type recombinase/integrase n=1 Tax=Thalassotalea psychrophila TaxID=3065647 RepID=A0ABY9TQB8_9GAMM|nr:tyrosine-type recombinase/integrase [Colwelliaceae bacterium SQ149]